MTRVETSRAHPLMAVLATEGRSPEIPEAADCYGWLVGSWELDVLHYWTDVRALGLKAEAHFGWVLDGRAVQDVWIQPRRADSGRTVDKALRSYGTTLRVWDPTLQAWRVTWMNPGPGHRMELVGHWHGKDVVQLGARDGGATAIRWIFSEIAADSFHWTGEALAADGITWKLEGEFRAKRVTVP